MIFFVSYLCLGLHYNFKKQWSFKKLESQAFSNTYVFKCDVQHDKAFRVDDHLIDALKNRIRYLFHHDTHLNYYSDKLWHIRILGTTSFRKLLNLSWQSYWSDYWSVPIWPHIVMVTKTSFPNIKYWIHSFWKHTRSAWTKTKRSRTALLFYFVSIESSLPTPILTSYRTVSIFSWTIPNSSHPSATATHSSWNVSLYSFASWDAW